MKITLTLLIILATFAIIKSELSLDSCPTSHGEKVVTLFNADQVKNMMKDIQPLSGANITGQNNHITGADDGKGTTVHDNFKKRAKAYLLEKEFEHLVKLGLQKQDFQTPANSKPEPVAKETSDQRHNCNDFLNEKDKTLGGLTNYKCDGGIALRDLINKASTNQFKNPFHDEISLEAFLYHPGFLDKVYECQNLNRADLSEDQYCVAYKSAHGFYPGGFTHDFDVTSNTLKPVYTNFTVNCCCNKPIDIPMQEDLRLPVGLFTYPTLKQEDIEALKEIKTEETEDNFDAIIQENHLVDAILDFNKEHSAILFSVSKRRHEKTQKIIEDQKSTEEKQL